jgi:hypothetical protein
MPVEENKISVKDALLIGGFVVQMAVTYGIMTTKLAYYEENQARIERTIDKLDNKIEDVLKYSRRSRNNEN